MKKQRAAIYARFSTDRQSEASLDDQFRVCREIARREEYDVVAEYRDAAISGGTTARPGYQQLLAAARRHEFDAIIVEDASRLWRELSEQWRALKELADLDIYVIGAGVDTRREEESRMLLAVTGAANEGVRSEIARRTRRGLEGRALQHKSTGGRCFGYLPAGRSESGDVEVNERQAEVVRRIFELYANGASPLAICRILNEGKVPSPGSSIDRTTRRKGGWQTSALAGDAERGVGILRNPRYRGDVIFGRTHWKRGASDSSKRRVTMRAKPLHVYHDERLRIVPEDLWNRVQERLSLRSMGVGAAIRAGKARVRAAGAGRPSKALMSGLLVCGQCGAKFGVVNTRLFGCGSHVNGRACTGRIHYVRRELVETLILRRVESDLTSPESLATLERCIEEQWRALDQQCIQQVTTPAATGIQTELRQLAAQIAAGKATHGALARCEELTALLRELEAQPTASFDVRDFDVKEIARELATAHTLSTNELRDLLAGGDIDRARDALCRLTGPIRLVEAPEATHLVATYDLGIDRLIVPRRSQPRLEHVARLSELMVAGARFPYLRRHIALVPQSTM